MDTQAAASFWAQVFKDAASVPLQDYYNVAVQDPSQRELVAYILDFNNTNNVTKTDYLSASKLFGPPKAFVANLVSLCSMPSFLGRMSGSEAKRVFDAEGSHAVDGTFVTRMLADFSGFEIDFIEKGTFKTLAVSINSKGFTSGGPTFETLPQFLQYYNTIYKRQYNRSYPRLSCFRWDLGLKETHALLKAANVNQFILRLSTSQANCLSMGYKQADGKPCQILITLGAGATYTVGNNTFTDFGSLLAAPSFINLVPLPSPTRALGAVQVAITEYFEREPTTTHYTHLRRGTSVAALDAPTTDPSLYLLTTQVGADYAPVAPQVQDTPTASAFPARNAFPTRAPSVTLSSFPTRAPSKSTAAAASTTDAHVAGNSYGDIPSGIGAIQPRATSPTPNPAQYGSLPSASNATGASYAGIPLSRQQGEQALIDALYAVPTPDRDHLFALCSTNPRVQNFLEKMRSLYMTQEQANRNRAPDI
jgi:hypothetical protein